MSKKNEETVLAGTSPAVGQEHDIQEQGQEQEQEQEQYALSITRAATSSCKPEHYIIYRPPLAGPYLAAIMPLSLRLKQLPAEGHLITLVTAGKINDTTPGWFSTTSVLRQVEEYIHELSPGTLDFSHFAATDVSNPGSGIIREQVVGDVFDIISMGLMDWPEKDSETRHLVIFTGKQT
jgi:hypothetical protein